MAELTIPEIFGQGAEAVYDPDRNTFKLTIDLTNFADVAEGGEIQSGLGISNIPQFASGVSQGNNAVALLYAIIILASQNQAASLNDDAEQSLFISQGGLRFGSGNRNSQIQRIINLNVFSDIGINNLPDIDELSEDSGIPDGGGQA